MNNETDDELNNINKRIRTATLISAPANILVGLGLFGTLSPDPGGLHSFFDTPTNSYALLLIGGVIALSQTVPLIKLSLKRQALLQTQNGE
ncbi:hypothetical protein LJ739_11170 [Aestuariibacter halophilus]|uniref:Uncharacterized protein n=1 Tax=Fluctibacter halophilus TaxID=226011 RepID=A0ABS8G890_9ALTE|nr:hypothetical protein [Aestuariibacter halophilus]MCC2616802.1 hypothetical protein [Aestuariibacter halophilus]